MKSTIVACTVVATAFTVTAATARTCHSRPVSRHSAASTHSHVAHRAAAQKGPHRATVAHANRSKYQPVAYMVPTWYGGSLVHPSVPGHRGHSASDYLSQMGGESRWPDGKRIRVYVAPGRPTYPAIIGGCLNQWASAAGHKFSWCFVSNPASADYTINWTTRTRELADGDEAGLTTTDTEVDPDTDLEYIDHARTRVLTRYEGRQLSDSEIQKTILHELGHGLGLEGHSSNCCDIMYFAVSSRQSSRLTARDCNTIARLYRG